LESDVSTKGHPALLYFGRDELESLEHDESNAHTLFLPPSTIGHLSWLDITLLHLQCGTSQDNRSSNPLLESELQKISVNSARSFISLSNTNNDMDPDEADANQVRQVMALKTFEGFENACHVVVELQDLDNMELCNLVAPNFAEVIVTNDLIGRLMLQCA
jgi:hypothetical protein